MNLITVNIFVVQIILLTTVRCENITDSLSACSQKAEGAPWGCILNPEGCNATGCNKFFFNGPGKNADWTNMTIGRRFDAVTSASAPQYVAIGFSNDTYMGDDYVIGCIYNQASDAFTLQSSHNVDHENQNIAADSTVNLLDSGQSNGLMWCTFERQLSPSLGESAFIFDLASPATFYLMLAHGDAQSENSIGFHTTIPTVSSVARDVGKAGWIGVLLSPCGSISCTSQNRLIAAHGIMMLMAWWLFAPTAIMLARFFKLVWPDTKIAGSLAWFQAHRCLNLSAVLFFLLALVFITVGIREWVGVPGDSSCFHAICGLLAIILGFTQPIMAIFRCHPKEKNRYIFNWAHRTVGMFAFGLATAAISSALLNFEIFRSEQSRGQMLGFVLWFILGTLLVGIVLSVLEFLSNRVQSKIVQRDRTDSTVSTFTVEETKQDPVQHYVLIRSAILGFYVVMLLAIVFTLCAFIGSYTDKHLLTNN